MRYTLRPRSALASLTLIPCAAAFAQPPQSPLVRTGGPDAMAGLVIDAAAFGPQARGGEPWRSFGVGAEVWDIGDRPVEWDSTTNQHALIVQNLYRAQGVRFEQVGMSWAKHVVLAANMPFDTSYGPCINPGFTRLGVNCGDVYSSHQNAAQNGLGPRYDVNPTTGVFTVPFAPLAPPVTAGDTLARRLIARESDTQAAANPGADYYAETALYAPDDAAWGNGRNNFSSRRLAPFPVFSTADQPVAFAGDSYRTTALEYWAWATPGVTLARADLHEQDATVVDRWDPYAPGDSTTPMLPQSQWVSVVRQLWTRFVAAGAATANANGTWTYDYAVLNVNSHRAGADFLLRLPAGATVTSLGFHAPEYHSGDRVRTAPWTATATPGRLAWRVDPTSESVTLPSVGTVTFQPNALRFATVYSFHVTVNAPPTLGASRLGLWRAPADAAGYQGTSIALAGLSVPATCTADLGSAGGVLEPDGILDNNDFIAFIGAFFNADMLAADLGASGGLPAPDNALDNNDFIVFINAFFAGCD